MSTHFAIKRQQMRQDSTFEAALLSDMVQIEKSILHGAHGLHQTPGMAEAADHMGISHAYTSVADTPRGDVHHVFEAPHAATAINGLMGHLGAKGHRPQYLGQNGDGNHVIVSTDHLGRNTYSHIKQAEPPATPTVPKPSWARRAIVALTRPKQAAKPAATPEKYDGDLHQIAASHGIAHYDTASRVQTGNNGQQFTHFSHLMTAVRPGKSIQDLHKTIASSHPTTEVKYNRVNVGGQIRHVYQFQHLENGALHTTSITRPASDHPGGKIEWQ